MSNHKLDITQHILDLIPAPHKPDLQTALNTWYVNIRRQGGLRLTVLGYHVLIDLDIDHWAIPFGKEEQKRFNKRLLIEMDRKLQYPYFISAKDKKIVFFSSKEAMLANLYGDIALFLKQYS